MVKSFQLKDVSVSKKGLQNNIQHQPEEQKASGNRNEEFISKVDYPEVISQHFHWKIPNLYYNIYQLKEVPATKTGLQNNIEPQPGDQIVFGNGEEAVNSKGDYPQEVFKYFH